MEGKKFGAPDPFPGYESSYRPPADEIVVFRLLCPVSQAGAVIGKSGSVIKQLQQSTKSRIRVEKAPIDSPDRVITIIASEAVTSRVKLGVDSPSIWHEEEGVQVSRAQEALIRVFEILDVESGPISPVFCRLLTERESQGTSIFKWADIFEKLTERGGCKVKIRTDYLPTCAGPDDVIVEIQGRNVSAVKQALVSASRFLQDCHPTYEKTMLESRSLQPYLHSPADNNIHETLPRKPVETNSHDYRLTTDASLSRVETIAQDLSQPREDFSSHCNSDLDKHRDCLSASTLKQRLSASEDDTVLKILCSTEITCDVIDTIQSETCSSLSLGSTYVDCDERLLTISENPEYQGIPVHAVIVPVYARLHDFYIDKMRERDNCNRLSIPARLVFGLKQIGCLLGNGGSKLSKLRKKTGASIQILKVEQNPICVSENDRVVQISGEYTDVERAIYLVVSRLRDDLFFHSKTHSATDKSLFRRTEDSFQRGTHYSVDADPFVIQEEEPCSNRFSSSAGYAPTSGRRSTMDHNDISHHSSDQAPSRFLASPPPAAPKGVNDGSGGLSSKRAGPAIDSGLKSPIVTNQTVEFRVPENAVNFVDGHNNLQNLIQVSGARVVVHEPRLGTREWIIAISGTPDQTRTAQKILHAFILTSESLSLLQRFNIN